MSNPRGNPKWVKGVSGNLSGKPPGTKDRKWANLEYWMELVQNEWPRMTAYERSTIAMRAFVALLQRRQLPPQSPEESVLNVEATMKTIQELQQIANSNQPIPLPNANA